VRTEKFNIAFFVKKQKSNIQIHASSRDPVDVYVFKSYAKIWKPWQAAPFSGVYFW
jgi:hypothetical protein